MAINGELENSFKLYSPVGVVINGGGAGQMLKVTVGKGKSHIRFLHWGVPIREDTYSEPSA